MSTTSHVTLENSPGATFCLFIYYYLFIIQLLFNEFMHLMDLFINLFIYFQHIVLSLSLSLGLSLSLQM